MACSITLFVMARNEERCIRRCIESASRFVDEVLVLDTGSSDATVAIANSTGATVLHRAWTDDFAASRNFGLENVSTDYVLSLDADEWLLRGTDELARIKCSAMQNFVFEIGIKMGSFTADGDGLNAIDGVFFTPRVFPRVLRYRGRVHESLVHTSPIERSSIIAGHDGYESSQLVRKRGRNLALLEKSLIEDPSNPLNHYYYAKELLNQRNGDSATSSCDGVDTISGYFLSALRLVSPESPNRELIVRETLLFYKRFKMYEPGIKLIFQSLNDQSTSRELSYLSAVFLYECILGRTSIPHRLLSEAGDAFFFRVLKEVDNGSAVYTYQLDMGLLKDLRAAASRITP